LKQKEKKLIPAKKFFIAGVNYYYAFHKGLTSGLLSLRKKNS